MENSANKFLIPVAIVFAGIVIAIAVFFSSGKNPSPSGDTNGGKTIATAVPEISSADFVLGDAGAPVTIIEYSDYQCPFCSKFFKETESVLREKYIKTGKVKFISRDFAFLGDESTWAAEAAHCAGEQGKFWQYHDYLFENQGGENSGAFGKDKLKSFAAALGLDKDKFNSCLDSGKYENVVKDENKTGGGAGVSGTPANFINGKLYAGAMPTANFTQIIDGLLNQK